MERSVRGFEEVHREGMRLLVDPAAPALGVSVAFTDRSGGVSPAPFDTLNLAASVGDDRSLVAENRARVGRAAGFDPSRLGLARQVHGADLLVAGAGPFKGPLGEADVLFTSAPGTTVAILTADCVPVAMVGPNGAAIAHAGWRGLIAGAIETASEAVGTATHAWVGPSIRACCYEVGPEVTSAFREAGLPVADEGHVDPHDAALFALTRAGITDVAGVEDCTSSDERYFSYRRDGVTGRQGGFITVLTA